jgi:hypothetical protein
MNKQKRISLSALQSRGTRMRMLSKSSSRIDINIGTIIATIFSSSNACYPFPNNACDPSSYLLSLRRFDIDNFNDVLESLNYDDNTITLKFREDKEFKNIKDKESNRYNINLPEFIGTADNIERPYSISIAVYFLPKGEELKDYLINIIKYNKSSYCDCDDIIYNNNVPYSGSVNSLGPSTKPPPPDRNPNPKGLLTFKIENQGYTGINGNRRLYILVSYDYRSEAPDFGFYVN